jgi:glycine/D-amino acid oxidase-like deaminating enzyme
MRLRPETPRERHRSLWLHDALAGAPAQPLRGATSADIAIVGGGYAGLWTAIELKRRDPTTDVLVVEQDVCGGGASGRNGGQAHSWWQLLDSLLAVCPPAEALFLAQASEDAIVEFERLTAAGFDIEFRRDGFLQTATTAAQLGAWDPMMSRFESLGVAPFRRLDRPEVAAMTGSPVHLGGVVEATGASVHPGKLVRALRTVALGLGVRLHENTAVEEIERRPALTLRCSGGEIAAPRVALAIGAWAAGLRPFRRQVFVSTGDVIATGPIPDRLAEIGWEDGISIFDSQARVNYYRTTGDHRAVLGRGGGMVPYGNRLGRAFDRDGRFTRDAESSFRRIYPALADVPVEHAWSGPIELTRAGAPLFGDLDGHGDVFYGVGYGTGVVQSIVGGRIVASLLTGRDDEWSRSSLVDQPVREFAPTPLTWAGGRVVRRALQRQARAEEAGRRPGPVTRRVAGLVPGP